jgi:ABC-type branched-subunit amino acid transport system substrate-binding protein
MRSRTTRRIVVLGAALAMFAAACGDSGSSSSSSNSTTTSGSGGTTTTFDTSKNTASDVGVTPTQITVGNVATLTGPIPGLFKGSQDATDAFFQYINSQGGVYGRKIVVKNADDGLDCNKNQSATQDMLNQVFAFVGSFSVFDNCSAKVLTANPTVPDVHYTLSSEANDTPNSFSPQPQPPGFRTGGYLYEKSKFPDAVSKVGSLWVNTSPTTWANQKQAMQSVGYTIVYERSTSPTETDFTSDIIRMKSAGVQYLDLRNQDKTIIARVLQAAAQQSFKPKVIVTNSAYDATFFKLLPDPSVANGVTMDQQYAMFLGEDAKSTPEVQLFNDWMKKTHPDTVVDLFAAYSWAAGRLFVEALQAAGPNPTRAGVLDALKNIHSFDANGMVAQTDAGNKKPPTCIAIVTINNGKFERTLPTDKGFQCDSSWGYFLAKQ